MNVSPVFTILNLFFFCLYQLLRELFDHLAANCSHNVHQLLLNCTCLLLGAEQVVYRGLLDIFHSKQLPAETGNEAVWAASSGDNSLCVHHIIPHHAQYQESGTEAAEYISAIIHLIIHICAFIFLLRCIKISRAENDLHLRSFWVIRTHQLWGDFLWLRIQIQIMVFLERFLLWEFATQSDGFSCNWSPRNEMS